MSMPGWVLSHAQAAHVADGSLDLAACRLRREDLEHHGIHAWLHGAGRLHAVATVDVTGDVRARDTTTLIDDDTTCWLSWNRYAEPPARDTGVRAVPIDDGGITWPAFFDHLRRSPCPVINSPKGQTAPLPPDLVRRPVVEPAVYQTWSLVWRRTEDRTAVPGRRRRHCQGRRRPRHPQPGRLAARRQRAQIAAYTNNGVHKQPRPDPVSWRTSRHPPL
jgi:hypothetical protein